MKDSSEVDVHAHSPALLLPHHSWKIFRESEKWYNISKAKTCIIDEAVEF